MSFGRLRLSTLVFVEMYSVTGHLPPSASLGAGFLFLNNVSINDRTLEYSLVVGTCYLVNSLQILPLMVSLPFIHQQSKKHVTVNINLDYLPTQCVNPIKVKELVARRASII
jgi:hypothetical protein